MRSIFISIGDRRPERTVTIYYMTRHTLETRLGFLANHMMYPHLSHARMCAFLFAQSRLKNVRPTVFSCAVPPSKRS
jgi:hypothetical protein